MSDFVRIALENGREASVGRAYAQGIEDVQILDKPATNSRGRVIAASRQDGRPSKPRTTVTKEVAKKAPSRNALSPATPTPSGDAATAPEEASK